jgi:hypothetical protein
LDSGTDQSLPTETTRPAAGRAFLNKEKTMLTSELTGAALDWAVAKCEGIEIEIMTAEKQHPKASRMNCECTPEQEVILLNRPTYLVGIPNGYTRFRLAYSTDWAQGGPIIEREMLCVNPDHPRGWMAITNSAELMQFGPTPLIAAMRCYVSSKLGDEVEIPEELGENHAS